MEATLIAAHRLLACLKQESPAVADKPARKHAQNAHIRRPYNVVAYNSLVQFSKDICNAQLSKKSVTLRPGRHETNTSLVHA